MSDFISSLAAKAGIDAGMAEKGVGALLTTLQQHVPADTFSKVSATIPNASSILSTFQSQGTAGSSLGGLAGLAGSLLGGKASGAASMIEQFSKAGFTMDTVKTFVPIALSLLKDRISPELMKQVEGSIPGLTGLVGGSSEGGGLVNKLKNIF